MPRFHVVLYALHYISQPKRYSIFMIARSMFYAHAHVTSYAIIGYMPPSHFIPPSNMRDICLHYFIYVSRLHQGLTILYATALARRFRRRFLRFHFNSSAAGYQGNASRGFIMLAQCLPFTTHSHVLQFQIARREPARSARFIRPGQWACCGSSRIGWNWPTTVEPLHYLSSL